MDEGRKRRCNVMMVDLIKKEKNDDINEKNDNIDTKNNKRIII